MSCIRLAEFDTDILRCFPVMAELRPHVAEGEFVGRVRRQMAEGGYHLAFLEENGAVKSVAGYRFSEILAWGKFLYVDDLVTSSSSRSQGHGQRLFDWLVEQARAAGCQELHLDSGVQRFGAHRFYLARHMDITSHHFAMKLR